MRIILKEARIMFFPSSSGTSNTLVREKQQEAYDLFLEIQTIYGTLSDKTNVVAVVLKSALEKNDTNLDRLKLLAAFCDEQLWKRLCRGGSRRSETLNWKEYIQMLKGLYRSFYRTDDAIVREMETFLMSDDSWKKSQEWFKQKYGEEALNY